MRKSLYPIATIHHGTTRAGMLLHIPHSSTFLPEELIARTHLMHSELKKYAIFMADLYTDELFRDERLTSIVAPLSRLFCDVERNRDDANEPMSHYRMGVVYEATYDGKPLIDLDETYRDSVLIGYYDLYHAALDDLALSVYRMFDSLIVIDCHSFHEEMVVVPDAQRSVYPDICIGYSEQANNPMERELVQMIYRHFVMNGYTVEHNVPFAGALIPNALTSRSNISSVMIEVNKRCYLKDNQERNPAEWKRIRETIVSLYDRLLSDRV